MCQGHMEKRRRKGHSEPMKAAKPIGGATFAAPTEWVTYIAVRGVCMVAMDVNS
jgi:hypothetical protein